MAAAIGRKRWAIPDGYIPATSATDDPDMKSHETVSMLNAGDRDANVEITIYFTDRDPAGPYKVVLPARRTRHVRLDKLDDPEPIPVATEYAILIESDVPIVVQHSRLDSRQAENALFTTIAFSE